MAPSGVREELRAVARHMLAGGRKEPSARDATEPEWSALADAGWLGLEVGEELGGSGASFAETVVVVEELARAVALTPFLGSVALGVGALGLVEPSAVRDALLRAVASGELALALAAASDDGLEPAFDLDGTHVCGHASFVVDAPVAERLLLVVRDADGAPAVVCVARDAPGISLAPQPVLDITRRLATVTAASVAVGPDAVLRFAGDPFGALERLRTRAAVAISADSLGVAEAMLAATVAYVQVRRQFGRAVGSFQAVKHACADMLVTVTVGRQLLDAAVDAVVGDAPEAAPAAARAKAYLADAAVQIAGAALQLHGGIGYTWESGVHLYLKRAMLDRALFGSPTTHRRRLARRWTWVADPVLST